MPPCPFDVRVLPNTLIARFATPQKALSWSLTHPGFQEAQSVVWLQVRDADLHLDFDPVAYAHQQLEALDCAPTIGLMTSRNVQYHHQTTHRCEHTQAHCLLTLGLSNAERVGTRRHALENQIGTINLLCHVDTPLSDAAMLETLSVATQARTAALLAHPYIPPPLSQPITGTGTDCIVITCPMGAPESPYAGTHTAVGEAVGRCVYEATSIATQEWLECYASAV